MKFFVPTLFVFILVGVLLLGSASPARSQTATTTVSLTRTLLTQPGYNFFTNDDVPLIGATWLSGGYFAISGFCSGSNNRNGLWVYSDAGSLVGSRDVCRDAGESANGSVNHEWSVVPNIQAIGPVSFVKEMSPNNERPALMYEISGGKLEYVSRSDSGLENVAAISGHAVATKNGTTLLYSLSDWDVEDRGVGAFIPITGAGSFIVGTPSPGNGDLVLYEVEDGTLRLVDRQETNIRPVAAAVDVAATGSSSRVGFLFINDGTRGDHVDIYAVGNSGFSLVRSVELPANTSFANTGWKGNLAVSGDYVAFVDCGLPALPAPSSGAADNAASRTCGLAVMRGNERLDVERLPNAQVNSAQSSSALSEVSPPAIRGIAMSPSGKILVMNQYGAYLYQIGDATNPSPFPTNPGPTFPSPTTPPPGLGVIQLGGIKGSLDLAQGYLLLLQALLGKNTGTTQSAPTVSGSTSTQFQDIFGQVSNLIKGL